KPFTVSAWHLYGWNTFESLYNPLWIAGFILMLVALRPLLQPVVPRRPVVLGGVALTVALLWFVHPHSAMVTIAVAATRPVFEWALRATVDFRRYVGLALALAVVGIFILAVTSWQMADPVYRDSAGQFFGTLRLDVFWYPLTLGLVLVQALRGATIWIRTRRPNGLPILAWIGTVIFLHSAPVINGYHFVPYLHLPLCVLAAAAMPKVGEHFMSPHLRTKGAAVVLMTALFGSFAFVTLESVTDVATRNRISLSHEGLIRELAGLPADRALVPPQLGNSVPAFTPHSVWAGHWALTRDFWPKVELYEHLTRDPARGDELKWLLESERIRYFVAPIDRSQRLGTLLSDRVEERRTIGELELFFMKSGH
ncbi:MAG: hypothetical protein OEO77_14545, partial [Acidimicrobiia bacterium]|nr:hypothetical protein [Acidimicrobiia bacterium]